ncbi:MAG: flagellar hook-associated protein 3 [Dehalococcoidia bacterium]|nr:flagellar hook-associated protein 3 [Dehalococcoidia bacterium]
MRVSSRSAADRLLQELLTSQRRLAEVQERVATGRNINKPSDDPFGTAQAMASRNRLELGAQHQRNIFIASSDLNATEGALASLIPLLHRAEELAITAANTTIDANTRGQIASEVDRLLAEAVTIGNTSHAGRYIFAGHQTDAPPLVPDLPDQPTVVNYVGDTGAIEREIGEGERMAVNVTGDQLFPALTQVLINFRDHLLTNDIAALKGDANLANDQLDKVLELRGDVGARVRRLELTETRLQDTEVTLRQHVAEIEEADMAEALVELQMRETALQAALGATGRSLNMSLMDFLR